MIEAIFEFMRFLRDFVNNYWRTVTTVFVGLFTLVQFVVTHINSLIQQLATYAAQLVVPEVGGAFAFVVPFLNFVNYVFPVAEAISALTGLAALMVASLTYRLVKSWLPTLS